MNYVVLHKHLVKVNSVGSRVCSYSRSQVGVLAPTQEGVVSALEGLMHNAE